MLSMISRNKRGMTLLKFVFNLIVGLILAGVLLFFFVSIAGMFFYGQEKLQASGQIDAIIRALEEAKKEGSSPLFLLAPKGWYVVAFDIDGNRHFNADQVPTICKGKNCVCICRHRIRIDCIKAGYCRVIDKPIVQDKQLFLKKITVSEFFITSEPAFYNITEKEKFVFSISNIISDEEFQELSMNKKEIQDFLEQKDSLLADYKVGEKSASQIIYENCKEKEINPKVIIATIQKEQGLIVLNEKAREEFNERVKIATGCGISEVSKEEQEERKERYGGFEKQIICATETFRHRFDEWVVGDTIKVDNQEIRPANKATGALYVYTPHIQANALFKKIYEGFFQET